MICHRILIFVLVCGLLKESDSTGQSQRLVKRIRKRPVSSKSEPREQSEVQSEEQIDTLDLGTARAGRFILGSLWQGDRSNAAQLPTGAAYSQPYTPYTSDLWGVESEAVNSAYTGANGGQGAAYGTNSPYAIPTGGGAASYGGSTQQPYYYSDPNAVSHYKPAYPEGALDNGLQDKTFDSIQQAVSGALGNNDGDVELDLGTKLARAALPAAVAAFLALTVSSVYLNQRNINATSKEEMPLLWQIPLIFPPQNQNQDIRQRRDLHDNEVSGEGFDTGLVKNGLEDYSRRLKHAAIMYAMMETNGECMKKVACIFGTKTKSSPQRALITDIIQKYMPPRLDGFTSEFIKAARSPSGQCAQYHCSSCFSV